MSLRDHIKDAQVAAMKSKDQMRLAPLRMLWSAIRNADIDAGENLSDEAIVPIISKQVKQLKDAMSEYEKGGRSDLKEAAMAELGVLEEFLPKQLSDEELRTKIQTILQTNSDIKDIGKVMGVVMKEVRGEADGTRVRAMVTELLTVQN
jgi:uncharacterized protein YqeY